MVDPGNVLILLFRSRDDSVENLFEEDEIVGDLPNEEGSFNTNSFLLSAVCILSNFEATEVVI